MRIITRQPRVLVQTWEVPDVLASGSNGEILAALPDADTNGVAAQGVTLVDTTTNAVAPRRIHTRGDTDLEQIGQALAKARAASQEATAAARAAAVAAYEAGQSERQIADTIGVERSTLRVWLGKQTHNRART